MNKLAVSVFACIVVALGAAIVKRQAPAAYDLPDGAELIVGSITTSFSCDNRIYGYYADVANRCQIFHVCLPETFPDGTAQTRMFSFFCGNQTVFDQQALVCANFQDALPCDQSESFYSVNELFGRTDVPFRT